jgi:L-glyceraldehyde 3-phosphate reductase
MAGELADPELKAFLRIADSLRTLAAKLDSTPAALAIAFALTNERVATVLFGATTAEQVAENARAIEVLDRLDVAGLAELRAIGT